MAEKRSNTRRVSTATIAGLELGKVPPQAVDLEEAVLGALMLEKDAVISVLDVLKPEYFYKETHQKIFQSIIDLSTKLEPIDILTVTQELRSESLLDEVGGAVYLAQLSSKVGSAAHIEYHSKIIAQKFIQRELIRISSDIQTRAFDDSIDIDDLLDYSEMELFKIAEGNIKRETSPISQVVTDALKRLDEASKRDDGLSGVPCGFSELDRMTSGWQPSDLVIVAARPSMGKTAFVLSMARNMSVDHKVSVAFFSLEMSSIQLVNRLLVSESGIPHEKIRNGKLTPHEWTQLTTKINDLKNSQIFIDDTPALSIFEFRAKCRRLKAQHDVGIIIIDYLQLMTGPNDARGNREQEVSTISRSLKAIAKELDVPIIALSQLNRSVETRGGNKRPQLSDLRESGAIEQDADMVLFIHRPEYYGFVEDEDNNSLVGLAEIIISKHRNGATGDIKLRFRKEETKFTDLDDTDFSVYAMDGSTPPQAVTYGSKMNEDLLPASSGGSNFDFLSGPMSDDEIPY